MAAGLEIQDVESTLSGESRDELSWTRSKSQWLDVTRKKKGDGAQE